MAKDPLERVRQAVDAATAAEAERYHAIADAVRQGHSRAEVGRAAMLTGQRITQILAKGPAPGPEAPFFGSHDGTLTIAVATKPEAQKDASGPPGRVTALETITAYENLLDLGDRMGLSVSEREPIPADGNVNLNRAGLVVICGPRLSPLVAQVLASDDALRFAQDGCDWYIQDDRTGKQWRSPMDTGETADIGYLARLPRPDGRGNFLYLAGIHAPGTSGTGHYLARNLPELWTKVRTARFSALIRCTFHEGTARQIESSELVAGPYIHER